MIRAIQAHVARFARDERGTASVEFVIVVPPLFFLFIMAFESGMIMIRHVMLERGLDMVMRELRLNAIPDADVEIVREMICEHATIFPSCDESLVLHLEPVSMATWALPPERIPCTNQGEEINPADWWSPSDLPHEVMLVRACIEAKPIFPTTGIGLRMDKSADGNYWLTAVSAFVNEPT